MSCPCGKHQTVQGCKGARILASGIRWKNTPSGKPTMRRSKTLCACGCGRRVRARCRYASHACVPRDELTAAMRAGWQRVSAQRRALRFKADIDRLTASGKVTREDLITFAHLIYNRAWDTCYRKVKRGAA